MTRRDGWGHSQLGIARYSLERTSDVKLSISKVGFRPSIERTEPYGGQARFLKHCSLKYLLSGEYRKVPHMLGFTTLEVYFWPKCEYPKRIISSY